MTRTITEALEYTDECCNLLESIVAARYNKSCDEDTLRLLQESNKPEKQEDIPKYVASIKEFDLRVEELLKEADDLVHEETRFLPPTRPRF